MAEARLSVPARLERQGIRERWKFAATYALLVEFLRIARLTSQLLNIDSTFPFRHPPNVFYVKDFFAR
jgi:hypothetical protein